MEAILASHPALSTKWLDWVAKWCEWWRMLTGSIDPSSRATGQPLLQAWRYVRLADPGLRSLRYVYFTENSSAFLTICIFILGMAMVHRTIAILDNHWWLGQSQRTLTLLVCFWEKWAQLGVPVKTPKKMAVQSQPRDKNFLKNTKHSVGLLSTVFQQQVKDSLFHLQVADGWSGGSVKNISGLHTSALVLPRIAPRLKHEHKALGLRPRVLCSVYSW